MERLRNHEEQPTPSSFAISLQGGRPSQMDRFFHRSPSDGEGGIVAVADGHGPRGDRAAEGAIGLVAERATFETLSDPAECAKLFADMHASVTERNAGTTVTICARSGSRLVVASVGDSPAWLVGADGALRMITRPHRLASNLDERERLRQEGAIADEFFLEEDNNMIPLSRAIGDHEFTVGLSHEPEIVEAEILPGDRFAIVATDGLWDEIEEPAGAQSIRGGELKHRREKLAEVLSLRVPLPEIQARMDRLLASWNPDDNLTVALLALSA